MGISLQQYRAAIGNWQAGRKMRTLEQSLPHKTTQADFCTTICKEGNHQSGHLKGLWKLHAALLCGLALALAFMISQSPYNRAVADTTYMSSTISNLDLAAATGNLISHQCHKALLVMAGVEPNPGPGSGIDTEDETVNKQEDIIAEMCSDAPNAEVRDCLRLYHPKNSIKQHKTEFAKCQKPVIINTLEFLAVTGQDQFTKPACINTLICRIQNLLPDKCNVCESEYMEENDLFNPGQHGFRNGRSCLSQLIAHYDHISQLLESDQNVDVVYLDFAKAFDKVDFLTTMRKLHSMGVYDTGISILVRLYMIRIIISQGV